MPIITPLFHTLRKSDFCHFYLCIFKRGKGEELFFGISAIPRVGDTTPTLDVHTIAPCLAHFESLDPKPLEICQWGQPVPPREEQGTISYLCPDYPEYILTRTTEKPRDKFVGWYLTLMEKNAPLSWLALHPVGATDEENYDWEQWCQDSNERRGLLPS